MLEQDMIGNNELHCVASNAVDAVSYCADNSDVCLVGLQAGESQIGRHMDGCFGFNMDR